jgi:hypothetical protein
MNARRCAGLSCLWHVERALGNAPERFHTEALPDDCAKVGRILREQPSVGGDPREHAVVRQQRRRAIQECVQ